MKIAVVTSWDSPFVWTTAIDTFMALEHPEGHETKFFRGRGWCSANRHNAGAIAAYNWGADYFLFCDMDEIFESDMVCRLLARMEEGYEAVCGLVPIRLDTLPAPLSIGSPNCWRYKDGIHDAAHVLPLEIGPNKDTIQRIDCGSTGLLMIGRHVLDEMEPPWFREEVSTGDLFERRISMDKLFCARIQREGKVLLWADVTIRASHMTTLRVDLNV